MEQLPYEIKDMVVQCFGRCFHYKDTVTSFLLSCGLSLQQANKYRDMAKFIWIKNLLNELDQTDSGRITQRKIITELCSLRKLPDSDVPDKDAGLNALRALKEAAYNSKVISEEKKGESKSRIALAETRIKVAEERARKLAHLKQIFYEGTTSSNRQKAGYDLEAVLKDLFALFEIEYKKPYKTDTQQIDGYFKFEGFDYLVEAKWRVDQPNEAEIAGFKRKISTKLDSTRGLFVSIAGFRKEVVDSFAGEGANMIFFTGEDLVHVLEGRVHLKDALTMKIERAAQYGELNCRIC